MMLRFAEVLKSKCLPELVGGKRFLVGCVCVCVCGCVCVCTGGGGCYMPLFSFRGFEFFHFGVRKEFFIWNQKF